MSTPLSSKTGSAPCLEAVPFEVLENIAFFAGTTLVEGPPVDLIPLLLTSRAIHSALAPTTNPHLYARIFQYKFDIEALRRHTGSPELSPRELCDELERRCTALTRMRYDRYGPTVTPTREHSDQQLLIDLWTLYVMALEDAGRNIRHLREWARAPVWLRNYWVRVLRPPGADGASSTRGVQSWGDGWAVDDEYNALAMWLYWFLLQPDDQMHDDAMADVLKVIALGAPKYRITAPSWMIFDPRSPPLARQADNSFSTQSRGFHYFGRDHWLCVPPLVAPAILSYFSFLNSGPVTPSHILGVDDRLQPTLPAHGSAELDTEWKRISTLGRVLTSQPSSPPSDHAFEPGSVAGVWEGMFIYTEFHMYTAIIVGAPPSFLQRSGIAQHRQTWRLQEHHLLRAAGSAQIKRAAAFATSSPLDGHSALTGYFVSESRLVKSSSNPHTLEVTAPGERPVIYHTWTGDGYVGIDSGTDWEVDDIIITGQGHSAWGQFQLLGRVRPCDGFINLRKTYLNSDRGQWLYRGFLVGGENGNISGRWRDTMSESEHGGYEGCFYLGRRR